MQDWFAAFHPWVNFLYFSLVLVFSMVLSHPLAQAIGLLFALGYAVRCAGRRVASFSFKFCLPMLALTAGANCLFGSAGATGLLSLPWGSMVTLEGLLYGLSAGALLVQMLLVFLCFHQVMTTDKLLALLGNRLPALSLVLSMALRFVPRLRQQLAAITQAQRSIGLDVTRGPLLRRLKTAASILSALITWALENAIDTADSMKSRGYGLPGRSSFQVYTLDRRDRKVLAWLGLCALYLSAGAIGGVFRFTWFPRIAAGALTPLSLSFYFVYFFMGATPLILNTWEDRKWDAIASAM